MGKTIYVMRHGEAEPYGISDFNRVLTSHGKREAEDAGAELLKRGAKPGILIASPAKRALETMRLAVSAMNLEPENILTDKNIYSGSFSDLLNLVHSLPDTENEVLLCGHNPGVSELCAELYLGFDTGMRTAEIVSITLNTDHWSEAGTAESKLNFQIRRNR